MTDARLAMILRTVTNVLFGAGIFYAWIAGKVAPEAALPLLIALAGLDVAGRHVETRVVSRSSQPPSAPKGTGPVPPAGPAVAALLVAYSALQGLFG